jgi:hypothetical protein
MTIILTPEQSALYEEGGFAAWRVEEDVIEDLDRRNITDTVVVTLDTGEILFAVSKGVIA